MKILYLLLMRGFVGSQLHRAYPLIIRVHYISSVGLEKRAIRNLGHPVMVIQIQSYKPIWPPVASLDLLWLWLRHDSTIFLYASMNGSLTNRSTYTTPSIHIFVTWFITFQDDICTNIREKSNLCFINVGLSNEMKFRMVVAMRLHRSNAEVESLKVKGVGTIPIAKPKIDFQNPFSGVRVSHFCDNDKIRKKGKSKEPVTFDDDDDDGEEGLDGFENDGFIVDDAEDEEGENPKQMHKKKKKRRKSMKSIVLDDDDLELIHENESINQENLRDGKSKRLKKAGQDTQLMEHSSDDGGSLFDDISEDESSDAEDDITDFIEDEEIVILGKGDSLRQKKFKDIKHSRSPSKEAKQNFSKAGLQEKHIKEVQFQSIESDNPNKYESFIPTNMYVAGECNSVEDTDIPERMQIIQDIIGSPTDRMSIEEESSWILSQLTSNINPLFNEAKSYRPADTVKREDIISFLELHHTKKYDIPFIAMYRKEQCRSLLQDPKLDELEDILLNDTERKPKLKWHKMLWMIKELDKKWLLLHKRKSMLMRYYNKHFEEECQMSFLEESSFHKHIFDSITNMLKKAETEREIDDIDMKFNLHFPPVKEFSDTGYKRPPMKSYYSNCCKAGLRSLASTFGNPEKFDSLLTLEKVGMDNEEDPQESPEEIASIYKCETFQTSEAVLKGARHMDAFSNFLLPSMEKEARALLNAKAKNWLLMNYAMLFWNKVSVAPYWNNDNATAQGHGVMACCWGNGKPGTTFVMLDSGGEFVDVMHAQSLTLRSHSINGQQSRKNDQKRVLKFLTIYQPCVIVLGAANASCLRLREEINEIISMMSEENFQNFSQGMKGLPAVVLGEEGLPRLYEDSEISMSQLPRQQGIIKRAVALGRYLLNPLAMIATLCGVKKELVSWKLSPLEKFLTSDEKLEIIEWVMTDVTNQVGININLAIRHNWLLAPLQFVSGLGPKKAGSLHRELFGGTDVRSRRDFAKFGLNTKKVFYNAVGFLWLSCNDQNFVDNVGNTLDRTRIHPESYNLAEELARAVYRQCILENPEDATQVNAIECIQNDPKLLECFDLIEYAERLEIEKGECKWETLLDIKMELLHGFKDPRRPYIEPTQEEEFFMITGETGDVLVEGKKVQAVVRHVLSKQAFCVLDSGMTAVLFKDDFSDETENISLMDKLHEGTVLTCKIKLIDKNRCWVHLTCKVSEMKNDSEQNFHDMDPYYCQGNIISPSQPEGTDKMEFGNKHFMPRMISHPNFQNITADQAKEFLADKDVGEYIFHPSSRGLCYLTLSLKIFNGLYAHKDIVEGGKSHNIKSLLGLGETLKVGEEIFEDIDKVIEHYVNPLVVHLKAMINFQKFKEGSKAEVDELLKLEKDEYPNRIAYGFGISYMHPGTFILSYIRSTNPHHEFIALHPKGFKFRKQIFKNVEQLLAYFQNHIYDNVGPAKTCITVGSFRESGGGWRSNNVDQQKQSIAYNDHGAGRGRGRGGRGRGFGPRSGPRDDCTGDVKDGSNFTTSNWGFGSSNLPDDSVTIGKGLEVSGSGEGNGWGQGRGRGRGRGRGSRGSYGDARGRRPWGGNSQENGRHADGGYSDAYNGSDWGQGQGQGRGRGRGRGRRGDGQGRGRWGGNGTDEERSSLTGGCNDAYNDSDWGQDQGQGGGRDGGRGRGRRSQGEDQGRRHWDGNTTNEDSREKSSWGLSFGSNAGSGNENIGWSVAHGNNTAPSGEGSGWGWTKGKSW
ncbi:hypothetical protein VNO77_25925 [Canavalia gladiata]|uniref:S1 motif domain-containing protein n=1 Tax=Canavalia gladiata TaxID=3824 RepID=A0AAN9KRF2_CANGL